MNLNISWPAPSPLPTCGYKAQYRRKGDPSYTEIDTSGTTIAVTVSAPASYEGLIISDCCNDSVSSGTPFGVNGFSAISVGVQVQVDFGMPGFPNWYLVTISSTYANSYDTIVSGNFHSNVSGTTVVPFSLTYPAGVTTSSQFVVSGPQPSSGTTISNINVYAVSPIFNNGGQLQQFDTVNTPPYFEFYWSGNISGTTWNGAPSGLPSFSLDTFVVTETNPDATVILAGNLNISYILHELYPTIYTSFTVEIFDPLDVAAIGTVILGVSPLGLRSTTIALVKGSSPLTTATAFIMKTILPDLTVLDTKTFYLPS